jgi:hypothetical protein
MKALQIVLPGHVVVSAMRVNVNIISYCALGSALAGQSSVTVLV